MKVFKNFSHSIHLMVFVLVISGCSSIKTGFHSDDKVSFNQYKSFSWIAEDPMIATSKQTIAVSPLTKKYIVNSIKATLTAKGYRFVQNTPEADFVVSYSIGTRDKIDIEAFPRNYRGHWDWYWHGNEHTFDRWHVRSWTEGTLMIDLFDNKSKEPVWHGWAIKVVTRQDRAQPKEAVEEAISKIFQDFPNSM